ncbi:MAG: YbhB/YbcL family Raf kinase inhibitor-like protein [Halioglobus sp.]|nr:YbhB/YbcL family Raf kinase inhibitor-like protein [Halioglobus sp.]
MGFALSDMQLTSDGFAQGEAIPRKYTGEGEDIAPGLSWTGAPADVRTFAVVCHDPDAPLVTAKGTYGFVHWVLYNIPGEVNRLEEGDSGYTAGVNDFGNIGYGGPMPPDGHGEHNYYFWVLALADDSPLEEGLTLWELLAKIEPHLLGMNRLVGRYERK